MRAVALGLAALVFLGGCGNGGDGGRTPRPDRTDPERTRPAETSRPFSAIDVEVRNGKVLGGLRREKVPLGNLVRLAVISDVADEVHVHGFEKREKISAGGGILMTFDADAPGIFVVELEEHGLHILELEVR